MNTKHQYSQPNNQVVIALGDPAGIGIEITLKALGRPDLPQDMQPLLVGCKRNVELIYSQLQAQGIKNLAKKTLDKTFNPKLIPSMSDEEAIIYLSELRQIGRWSAEMILLFTYNRSNIWPIQDIGLLRAISKNYKKKYLPPDRYVKLLNKKFSPYCSVATWYLWRSIDPEPIQY